ncbi:KaiC domain-containing protein [Haladaptatus sp. NG-SE-30]
MTEDDDWFEAALRRDDEDEDSRESSESPESEERPESDSDSLEPDHPESPESVEDDSGTPVDEPSASSPDDATDFGTDAGADFEGDATADAGIDTPTASGADDADSEPLFDDDFADALKNAPNVGGTDEPDFGESGGGAFGGGFDDGGFGGGGAFGGGGLDDGGFDDEEFESDIPRIDIGIDGLDSMIQGGVPERTLMVAIGNAGTGKTTFGLQFLNHALSRGESAVYITLEESHERIINSATEKGWPYDEYVADDRLAVVDIDPIEMANSLSSIQDELPGLVRDFGATRLVLDSVSLLEMMFEDRAARRNEIYDFTRSLKEAGVTTMLTSEASDDNPYASRHGIIEYLTDAVFILQYVRGTDDFRETRLAIEIQKIRDANHSRDIKPYDITNEGISVYQQANLF